MIKQSIAGLAQRGSVGFTRRMSRVRSLHQYDAFIAQLGEHGTDNREVDGSNLDAPFSL